MDDQLDGFKKASQFHRLMTSKFGVNVPDKNKVGGITSDGRRVTLAEVEIDIVQFADEYRLAELSKTIVFPSEQVEVFSSLLVKGFGIPLEYNLPFPQTLLEFTNPVEGIGQDGPIKILGILLEQSKVTKSEYEKDIDKLRHADDVFGFGDTPILPLDWSNSDFAIINEVRVICDDFSSEIIKWTSQSSDGLETLADLSDEQEKKLLNLKTLAIACIGYINCENVYLHKEGEVSEAINAKRERKGKSRLEPYYVCRIRGVQYDSQGYEKGTGVKHGIRYDVRGHFRHLATGKTTWVRAHQRGLQNELYVPKTYLVDKKVN
jgi:hypothetical protein